MSQDVASDRELLLACRNGDMRAWEQLFEKYERLVFSIPLNYGLSRDDAADVAQLTFTALIEQIETLHEESRLGAWLALVARRNTWRAMERGRREQPDAATPIPESGVLVGQSAADPLERWELTEWIHRGLSTLSERCRALLIALYFEPAEPAYTELAERFSMPLGSIGPTRARCLERLRQMLER